MKSGNLATDLLLEHVGTGEVAAVLRDAGCSPRHDAAPRHRGRRGPRRAGLDNLVTAADLARVLAAVATGAGAARHLRGGRGGARGAGAPRPGPGRAARRAPTSRNKTGWVDGVAHDVALVRPDGLPAYVLAVCTHRADADERRSTRCNAAVSAAVWERWTA